MSESGENLLSLRSALAESIGNSESATAVATQTSEAPETQVDGAQVEQSETVKAESKDDGKGSDKAQGDVAKSAWDVERQKAQQERATLRKDYEAKIAEMQTAIESLRAERAAIPATPAKPPEAPVVADDDDFDLDANLKDDAWVDGKTLKEIVRKTSEQAARRGAAEALKQVNPVLAPVVKQQQEAAVKEFLGTNYPDIDVKQYGDIEKRAVAIMNEIGGHLGNDAVSAKARGVMAELAFHNAAKEIAAKTAKVAKTESTAAPAVPDTKPTTGTRINTGGTARDTKLETEAPATGLREHLMRKVSGGWNIAESIKSIGSSKSAS